MGYKTGHKGVASAKPRICEQMIEGPDGKRVQCSRRATKGKRLCEHCNVKAQQASAEAQARGASK